MKNRLFLLLLAVAVSLPAAPLPRTFVHPGGNDADNCSRSHPCATFAGALVNTSDGGEIDVLTSGDYGPLTVSSQNVTVDGLGFTVTGSPIQVNLYNATLRNLTLASTGTAITITGHGIVKIERVVIHPDTTGGGTLAVGISSEANLFMQDVRIQDAGTGVVVINGGVAALSRCNLIRNGIGLTAYQGGKADVDHSIIQNNSLVGVSTDNNDSGNTPGTIRLSDTTITDNGIGMQVGGTGTPVLVSYGNNRVYGNTVNGTQTLLTSQR